MASAGGSGSQDPPDNVETGNVRIPAPGELPGYTFYQSAPWGGGAPPEYSPADPLLAAEAAEATDERPRGTLRRLTRFLNRRYNAQSTQSAGDSTGPTFSSQGVVYMVAADDPQVNRVVVVTSETPQNAEAQYLEDLRNIAGIQQAVQAHQNPSMGQVIQGHVWKRLPRLVTRPMHMVYPANRPIQKLLIDEVSRPANSMTEIRIRSHPQSSDIRLFTVPMTDEHGNSYMAESGRSIFQLPDGYTRQQDEQYRGMFCAWLEKRNELRGNELGTWEPTEQTNIWIFQTLDAETAWPIPLVLEENGTFLGAIERWWVTIPNRLKSEFHEAVETAFIFMTMSMRRNPGPAYPDNPTGYDESLLLPERFPEKIASIPTPANPFPSLKDYLETNHGRKITGKLADQNMLPAPTDHVDVIPPSTIAPPVRGLFKIPMYFGQIQVYGDLYRSDPQRYPLYRVFDRQPVSRAPDGAADPQKVHYVPPDPDPWVAVVYQQRQRRIENQQRASDQQIRPEIQQAQSQQRQQRQQRQQQQQQQPEGNQQQMRRGSQSSNGNQNPGGAAQSRRGSRGSQESKHSQNSQDFPYADDASIKSDSSNGSRSSNAAVAY